MLSLHACMLVISRLMIKVHISHRGAHLVDRRGVCSSTTMMVPLLLYNLLRLVILILMAWLLLLRWASCVTRCGRVPWSIHHTRVLIIRRSMMHHLPSRPHHCRVCAMRMRVASYYLMRPCMVALLDIPWMSVHHLRLLPHQARHRRCWPWLMLPLRTM